MQPSLRKPRPPLGERHEERGRLGAPQRPQSVQ